MKKWPTAMPVLIVGFYVAFSLLIPTLIGVFWLGPKFGHTTLFTLIGLGVGTIVMVYGVYRMVKPFLAEAEKEQLRGPAKMLSKLTSSEQKRNEEQE